ncbi:MAG: ASCH domain-containing protein [Bacteroidota bacterium]
MNQLQLFSDSNKKEVKSTIKIVRIDEFHAKYITDPLLDFNKMILSNEQMYPGIGRWLKEKVIPGLRDKERIAFIAYANEKPVISAVVKRGNISKFCHLKINNDYQDKNFGEMFFTLMSLEIRNFAKSIYFTLPENLWEKEKNFFGSFGFNTIVKNDVQYRNGETELRSTAQFQDVWETIPHRISKLKKIFNAGEFSLDNGIVLSIKPQYADAILSGRKKVEIRTRFDENLLGSTIAIYSTSPQKAVVGQAKIAYVVKGHPRTIWEKYSNEIQCTKKEYNDYTSSCNQVYAILLDEVKPFKEKVLLNQLSYLTKFDLKPPQSYYKLQNKRDWSKAVSIATILQNNFKTETIFI